MGCCASAEQEGIAEDDDAWDVEEMLREQQAQEEAAGSTVELKIRCCNLVEKCNPFVAVMEVTGDEIKFIGRTESIPDETAPQFSKPVSVQFRFEVVQNLVFLLRSEDFPGQPVGEQPAVGEWSVTMPELTGAPSVTASLWKNDSQGQGTKVGTIIVAAERKQETASVHKYECILNFSCRNLFAMNMMGAGGSDPFLVISNVKQGTFTPVYQSEHVENVTACDWKQIVMRLDRLCGGDFNAVILLEVYDWERSGRHRLIGLCRTTLAQMLSGYQGAQDVDDLEGVPAEARYAQARQVKCEWDLVDAAKVGTTHGPFWAKEQYQRSGVLTLNRIKVDQSHSFLDYVRGGFEINLSICVDFSFSNGSFDDIHSLHYRDPAGGRRTKNEYTQALENVISVLRKYDKDQEFPFWGFGAKDAQAAHLQGPEHVHHIFPVSGTMEQVEVTGIEGVLDAYWGCLERMAPAEPTYFSKCLDRIYRVCAGKKDAYQIVLFVTDGQIDKEDLRTTTDLIVACGDQAISIIIVGVGRGPFDYMEYLDGGDVPLKSSDGRRPTRDLVGFVEYRKYSRDPAQLQRETLKEIPRQFLQWAKLHGVKPPAAGDDAALRSAPKQPPRQTSAQSSGGRRRDKRRATMAPSESSPLVAAMPTSPLVEKTFTIIKRADEGMGVVLDNMEIADVQRGTAAERSGARKYIGWRVTHVNDTPVKTVEDVAITARPAAKVVLRIVEEPGDDDYDYGYEEEEDEEQEEDEEEDVRSLASHQLLRPQEEKRGKRRKRKRKEDLLDLLELSPPRAGDARERRRRRKPGEASEDRGRRAHHRGLGADGAASADSSPLGAVPYQPLSGRQPARGEARPFTENTGRRGPSLALTDIRRVESEASNLHAPSRARLSRTAAAGSSAVGSPAADALNNRLSRKRPPPLQPTR